MLVLLLGITPPGINNSVEYAAYREADTALWYDSGNSQKSGRFQPERVAALNRITRQVYSGMGGSFAPDFPIGCNGLQECKVDRPDNAKKSYSQNRGSLEVQFLLFLS
jgi:hypothetical protein